MLFLPAVSLGLILIGLHHILAVQPIEGNRRLYYACALVILGALLAFSQGIVVQGG